MVSNILYMITLKLYFMWTSQIYYVINALYVVFITMPRCWLFSPLCVQFNCVMSWYKYIQSTFLVYIRFWMAWCRHFMYVLWTLPYVMSTSMYYYAQPSLHDVKYPYMITLYLYSMRTEQIHCVIYVLYVVYITMPRCRLLSPLSV